jgi:proline racemase
MVAATVTEPVSTGAHFGLIYMDARRYPYLCGHATIGAVTTLIETAAIEAPEGNSVIVVDTPSGPLKTFPQIKNGRVLSVGIDMVPSFVSQSDIPLEVPGFGNLNIDLVYVGGFFAMVSAPSVGLELTKANSRKLISLGMSIIEAANNVLTISHPERPEGGTVDVTEFYHEDAEKKQGTSVVIYGEAHMDRSPCGTGTTAKMTLMHHRNKLSPGEVYTNGSPLGTIFEGRIVKEIMIGGRKGIIGRIKGSASVTGYHQFVVDSTDPFPQGFLL